MTKALITILLLICLAERGISQADTALAGMLNLYVVPLPWIDKNPRLRLGMEYTTNNHMGYSLEVGYGNKHLNTGRLEDVVWGQEYSFIEFRPEVKWYRKTNQPFPWYLNRPSQLPRYLAVELFYQQMHDQLSNNDFSPKAGSTDIAYDQASFKKIKIGATAKVGFKVIIWKKVVLDFYEGLGLAYRKISYTNIVNPIPFELQGTNEEWWPKSYKNEGAYFLFQLSFGVRVGYIIGKI